PRRHLRTGSEHVPRTGRTQPVMRRRICLPFIAALALLAGCESVSTKDLGTMVEQGAIIAGEDPAEAQRIGQAASGVTGLFGSMDAQTERELGGGIAVKAFSEIGPLHPDRDLQRYVNLVGRP